jgi:hypothetical protein
VVSAKTFSSSEERSTTGTFSEGLPYSKPGEWRQSEEISNGDPSGGGDPDGADSEVEALLGDEDPSLEGGWGRLVPLLSSIMVKRRRKEKNPKQKVKECEMVISARRRRYI